MIKLKRLLIFIFLGAIFLGIGMVLVPRSYDVEPFEIREGTQYWDLNTGSRIGYFKINSVEAEKKNPVIYLHGGPGGKIVDEVIETLKPLSEKGHDLYFYDQIGSGHSARLEDIKAYSVERHQNDLREIVSKTGSEKVILIGHSWGALLAINYIEDYDETVEKIILTGPGPILPVNKKMKGEIAPDSLSLKEPQFSNKEGNEKIYDWRSKLILKWAYLFNSKLASDKEADDFFTYLNTELVKSTDCEVDEQKKFKGGVGYYSHIMTVKSFRKVADRRDKLRKLDVPILIIRGQCDNQKWGFTKEYLDIFKNSKLSIINGAGHDLIGGDRKQYYTLIDEFLHLNQD